jgi:uncharacterized protein DUF4157
MSQGLPPGIVGEYGARMGVDLSDVRVHTDRGAAERTETLGARAFAEGSDVHFAQGEYDSDSDEGRELLAHELVHVAQAKRGAKGAMTKRADGASAGDHETEADRGAQALVHGSGAVRVAAAPVSIMRKPHDHDRPASAGQIRHAILECDHQMVEVSAEISDQDRKSQKEGAGPSGKSTGRALTAIVEIQARLGQLAPAMTRLAATEKQELVPLARNLVVQAGRVFAGHETMVGPHLVGLKRLLGDALGDLGVGDSATDIASHEGVLAVNETGADRAAEASELFAAIQREIAAAIQPNQHDLVGPAGIGHLEALHAILQRLDYPSKLRLQPEVKQLLASAHVAQAQYEKAPRVRELMARINAIFVVVALGDVSGGEEVGKILDQERVEGRGYTDAQMASFERATGELHDGIDHLYHEREAGVTVAEREADTKEKPPSHLWQDFAIAALTIATGGIAGAIVGGVGKIVADKVLRGVAESMEKSLANAVTERIRERVVEAVKEVPSEIIKKATDKGIDAAADKLKEAKEAREIEAPEDGPSANPKIAFFQAQRDAIEVGKGRALTNIAEVKQEQRSHFSSAPQAATLAVQGFAETLLGGKDKEKPQEIQANATAAQWAALLNGADVGTRTKDGHVDLQGEIDGSIEGNKRGEDFAHYARGEVTIDMVPGEIRAARVKGLGLDLRARLQKTNLAEVNVPIRVLLEAGVGWGTDDVVYQATRFGRNSQGDIFVIEEGSVGKYLRSFAPSETDPRRALEQGAKHVIENVIGNKPLPVKLDNAD